jgi:hypothetical protein
MQYENEEAKMKGETEEPFAKLRVAWAVSPRRIAK